MLTRMTLIFGALLCINEAVHGSQAPQITSVQQALQILATAAQTNSYYAPFVAFFNANPGLIVSQERMIFLMAYMYLTQLPATRSEPWTSEEEALIAQLEAEALRCGGFSYHPIASLPPFGHAIMPTTPGVNPIPQSCTFQDVLISGDLQVNGIIINPGAPGSNIPPNNIAYVQKSLITAPNQFNSVNAALAAVTALSPSATNPFLIKITPGIYVEPTLNMVSYVTMQGSGPEATILQAANPSETLIVGASNAMVRDVAITGVTTVTPSNAAVTYTAAGAFYLYDVQFINNDFFISMGNVQADSFVVLSRCSIPGMAQFHGAFAVSGASGVATPAGIIASDVLWDNVFNSLLGVFAFVSGPNYTIRLTNSAIGGLATAPGGTGVTIDSGATFRGSALDLNGFSTALSIPNVGSGSSIIVDSVYVNNSSSFDLNVASPTAVGSISGVLNAGLVSVVSGAQISLLLSNPPGDTNPAVSIFGEPNAPALSVTAGTGQDAIDAIGIVNILASNPLKLSGTGGGSISIEASTTITAPNAYTLIMPDAQGTAGQVLAQSGTPGTLVWEAVPVPSNVVLIGGNTITPVGNTMAVGTLNASPLSLITDGNTTLSIDTNGSATLAAPTGGTNPTLVIAGSTNAATLIVDAPNTSVNAVAIISLSTSQPALAVDAVSGDVPAIATSFGSALAPAYSFIGRTSTGMYSAAAGELDFATSGSERVQVASTGDVAIFTPDSGVALTVNAAANNPAVATTSGSAAAPSYSFSSTTSTGMYSAGPNTLNFATAGNLCLTIGSVGNVSISTPATTGVAALTVNGTTGSAALNVVSGGASASTILASSGGPTVPAYSFTNTQNSGMYSAATGEVDMAAGGTQVMKMTTNGAVPFSNYKMSANRQATTQTIVGGTFQNVVFDNVLFDPLPAPGSYDNTTGIFTAPATGTYLINAMVNLSVSGAVNAAIGYGVATLVAGTIEAVPSSVSATVLPIVMLQHLNVGDQIYIQLLSPAGIDILIGNFGSSALGIHLLSF